jgi:hypothetical protein
MVGAAAWLTVIGWHALKMRAKATSAKTKNFVRILILLCRVIYQMDVSVLEKFPASGLYFSRFVGKIIAHLF